MKGARPPGLDINEKDFGDWLRALACLLGWECYHPWLSIHSPRGWPDWALCRPPRLVLAELKTEKGKTTPAQDRWGELLEACTGVEYYLWRPRHRDDIERVLR